MKDPQRVDAALRGWTTQRIPPEVERELVADAIGMRRAGMTLEQIAKVQGVGRDKVSRRLWSRR